MIFLSHSEKDRALVERVFWILHSLKLNPYMHEQYPEFGEFIPEVIKRKLFDSHYVLAFLTKNGISSQWVNQEIGMAEAFGKKIIPITETGVKSKGFVELKHHVKLDPENVNQNIFDIIYTFRGLYDIKDIEIECPKCEETFYPPLCSFEMHCKDARKRKLWEYKCPYGHKVLLSAETLEIIKENDNRKKI